MRSTAIASIVLAAACLALFRPSPVQACPFCSTPSLTMTEQLAQSDAAVLVRWTSGVRPTDNNPGRTVYEIVDSIKGPKASRKEGTLISLVRYRRGKKGDLYLLMGSKAITADGKSPLIEWGSPLEISKEGFEYVAHAPPPESLPKKRLTYFLKFMENSDQLVSNDAYSEFANAPYKDIKQVSDIMPREKIRNWISSPETPATRIGLYGLLLGLCGQDEDARVMEQKITEKTDDFRLGIDGVMSGLLLLKGEQALDLIDREKLKNKDVPFSETYAAMMALRFMWSYGENQIEKERLRQSMRILLDRPELADLVIADLARWKDWSVQERLMALYDSDEYNIPSIKRAVVRFMLVSTKDLPSGDAVKIPDHVIQGRRNLDVLRKKDPKTVREAERFFFLN